jgi:uncharacterized protein YciI
MPLFVISWMDKPDSLEVRMGAREAHLAYFAQFGERVKLGGPYLDEAGRMAGSMAVIEAERLEEVQAIHARDPYKLAGLFERSEIRPWRMTVGSGMPAKQS